MVFLFFFFFFIRKQVQGQKAESSLGVCGLNLEVIQPLEISSDRYDHLM